ncbi:MAG: hypothetical protein RIF37_01655 [Rhodospirillaceae bacterium]
MSDVKLHPTTKQARRRDSLKPDDINKVGHAILTLAQELWAVKDRQMVTEQVLKARNIDIAEAIDTFQPDPEMEAKLAASRQALVKKIITDLTGDYGPLDS